MGPVHDRYVPPSSRHDLEELEEEEEGSDRVPNSPPPFLTGLDYEPYHLSTVNGPSGWRARNLAAILKLPSALDSFQIE
ncbi:hypothetical protein GWI33_015553 [Rhynchophorus ferrugineus]|uniref:Uncharacterized protein n=1 Tax=Rhynchophorus ferrugineus TaxID=354439 RepID=A0A834I347_RHYFE|nr:hypothetical protein GWI33_015553 [Rhynchophorus ferrugineus]